MPNLFLEHRMKNEDDTAANHSSPGWLYCASACAGTRRHCCQLSATAAALDCKQLAGRGAGGGRDAFKCLSAPPHRPSITKLPGCISLSAARRRE